MRYSYNRNYRDSIIEEVNKTIEKLDKKNEIKDSWLKKILIKLMNKIKLYMSYLKLK
jgi:hypothetical protein